MAARQDRGGYIFLVYQSTQSDSKDSPPAAGDPTSGYFKISKCYGDDIDTKDRDQKINNLKKGNPCVLTMNTSCCIYVKKDAKKIKKEIKVEISCIPGVQQLKRGWFYYNPSQDQMPTIVQIFNRYGRK